MSFLKCLNQFIALFIDTFKMFGRGKIWLILLLYFLLNWLLLYAHYDFLSPVFYGLISAWTRFVSESNAVVFSHYPGHFLLLPHYFGLAKFGLGLIFEGLVLGIIAVYFRDSFLGVKGPDRRSARSIAASWIYLGMAWLCINLLTMAVTMYFPDWLRFLHDDSPRRLLAVEFVIMPGTLALILALFYFAIPVIAISRSNILSGIAASLRVFARRPFTCFLLAACILAGPYLMSALAGRSGQIIDKFRPEMVYWMLLAGLVVEMVANFFWMGTAVRFLLEDEIE